ncbi:MAG: beta-N-acetylhexosaminidase, partial [Ferruginibacter sp.]
VKMGEGIFYFTKNTTISYNNYSSSLNNLHKYLNKKIKEKYGFSLKIVPQKFKNKKSNIQFSITKVEAAPTNSYNLSVSNNELEIDGFKDETIFQGIQTLLQLIEKQNNKLVIPQLTINDFPRFKYRGMHLDVGRHFYPIAYIKKYIDYLATYKYNTFHWHLTEDQGWRIEIKKYPNLTKIGSYRERTLIGRFGSNKYDSIKYGGYYSQNQIKEIVKYATERYINVIPEIEMPGHSTAALASYPFLGCTKGPYKTMDTWGVLDDVYCAGNDSTFNFLQNVLDEVLQLFPSKYIHIGGDECPKERWKKCTSCQKRMKDNNLKDEHALQSYFIQRIEKYINSKGRSIIGWDEILEGGLAPNATVMSWRGETGGIEAAKQNHDVIMTPGKPVYFDHSQTKNEDSVVIGGYNSLETVYNYEPIPKELNAAQALHVLGAQGNVWTEYMNNTNKLEYMIFPRMIALSEVLWSPKANKSWIDFERRLPTIFERLDFEKINYSKAYYDLDATVLPTENNEAVYWKLEYKNSKHKIVYKNEKENSKTIAYSQPIFISTNDSYSAWTQNESGIDLGTKTIQKFYFNKATGKKISIVNQPSKTYPGNGAFTLVNAVQNTRGTAKASEFLGFQGTDLDVTIDFGKDIEISTIKLHTLNQNRSWIYLPTEIEVSFLPYIDTTIITRHPPIVSINKQVIDNNNVQIIELNEPKTCRYLRVFAKNFGTIPIGKPGEGKQAWLFADEIEVE